MKTFVKIILLSLFSCGITTASPIMPKVYTIKKGDRVIVIEYAQTL